MATKSIQIRNVPEKLHAVYRVRAAKAGKSLSEYLLGELRRAAQQPTQEEWFERVNKLTPVELKETGAEAVRAGRAEREEEMDRWLSTRRRSSKS